MKDFTQKNQPAQEAGPSSFEMWLFINKKTQKWVCDLLDLSCGQVSRIVSADSCIKSHRETLLAAGVPESSLPKLSDGKVGRKPKPRSECRASA
ncbi:hypothetical protein [Maridesulfovibrio ferrireducens]|uniref:hypothetical protein n=1 Tax=Maridesulfovibrio ferrireducens TaxID=246191 RepID=UPI001A26255D|nr:hypothetical protein [Maridesulfovibrio ferrireducens]MBI9110015.1 hypothetical protein [Maridesulfovibrio ferrireducens]